MLGMAQRPENGTINNRMPSARAAVGRFSDSRRVSLRMQSPKPNPAKNVLLDVTSEKSIIMATDMEVGIRVGSWRNRRPPSCGRRLCSGIPFSVSILARKVLMKNCRLRLMHLGIVVRGAAERI